MNTPDQQSYIAVDRSRSLSNDDWTERFPGVKKKELFDLVTSMFLDYPDEKYIAESLSEHYGVNFTPTIIRNIRLEAALEADRMESPESRKKWIFRYRYLTVNNLVKEYMFITHVPNFFEAKVELADELYWLGQKYSKKRLWIAINEALGRNDIPLELVDEILEFRQTMVRVKQLVRRCAEAQGVDPVRLLLEVSKKVDDAYRNECQKNSVRTAQYAYRLLEVEPGSIMPSDVKFFREYFKCSQFPERTDKGSLVRLIEGADTLQEYSVLNEAACGNIANLSQQDIQQLIREMRFSPVLKAEELKRLYDDISGQLSRGSSSGKIFKKLKKLIRDHLTLTNINKFYSRGEFYKLRVQNVSLSELQNILETANALASHEEVVSYLTNVIETSSVQKMMKLFAAKYCEKRFAFAFPSLKSVSS